MRLILSITILVAVSLVSCQSAERKTKWLNTDMPNKLNGMKIHYQYSGGNSYNIHYKNDSLCYQFLNGGRPNAWWGPFEYHHMMTDQNEHIVGWYENGYGDYITQIIDFEQNYLIGSGVIMPDTIIHFQRAKILGVEVEK